MKFSFLIIVIFLFFSLNFSLQIQKKKSRKRLKYSYKRGDTGKYLKTESYNANMVPVLYSESQRDLNYPRENPNFMQNTEKVSQQNSNGVMGSADYIKRTPGKTSPVFERVNYKTVSRNFEDDQKKDAGNMNFLKISEKVPDKNQKENYNPAKLVFSSNQIDFDVTSNYRKAIVIGESKNITDYNNSTISSNDTNSLKQFNQYSSNVKPNKHEINNKNKSGFEKFNVNSEIIWKNSKISENIELNSTNNSYYYVHPSWNSENTIIKSENISKNIIKASKTVKNTTENFTSKDEKIEFHTPSQKNIIDKILQEIKGLFSPVKDMNFYYQKSFEDENNVIDLIVNSHSKNKTDTVKIINVNNKISLQDDKKLSSNEFINGMSLDNENIPPNNPENKHSEKKVLFKKENTKLAEEQIDLIYVGKTENNPSITSNNLTDEIVPNISKNQERKTLNIPESEKKSDTVSIGSKEEIKNNQYNIENINSTSEIQKDSVSLTKQNEKTQFPKETNLNNNNISIPVSKIILQSETHKLLNTHISPETTDVLRNDIVKQILITENSLSLKETTNSKEIPEIKQSNSIKISNEIKAKKLSEEPLSNLEERSSLIDKEVNDTHEKSLPNLFDMFKDDTEKENDKKEKFEHNNSHKIETEEPLKELPITLINDTTLLPITLINDSTSYTNKISYNKTDQIHQLTTSYLNQTHPEEINKLSNYMDKIKEITKKIESRKKLLRNDINVLNSNNARKFLTVTDEFLGNHFDDYEEERGKDNNQTQDLDKIEVKKPNIQDKNKKLKTIDDKNLRKNTILKEIQTEKKVSSLISTEIKDVKKPFPLKIKLEKAEIDDNSLISEFITKKK